MRLLAAYRCLFRLIRHCFKIKHTASKSNTYIQIHVNSYICVNINTLTDQYILHFYISRNNVLSKSCQEKLCPNSFSESLEVCHIWQKFSRYISESSKHNVGISLFHTGKIRFFFFFYHYVLTRTLILIHKVNKEESQKADNIKVQWIKIKEWLNATGWRSSDFSNRLMPLNVVHCCHLWDHKKESVCMSVRMRLSVSVSSCRRVRVYMCTWWRVGRHVCMLMCRAVVKTNNS